MYSRKELELSKLVLDDKNPRLNITIRKENESIEEQFLRTIDPQQIIELMKSMLNEMSFNPSNIFSVIDMKNGEFLVLDGNRRTLATMILSSTSIIKNKDIEDFKKVNATKINIFLKENKRVLCAIYKNREEAMKWIDMNHLFSEKGISTLPWETFARRIAEKNQFAILFKKILDEEKIEIKDLNISYTVFERVFEDKDIKNKFGITKNSHGDLNIENKDLFFSFVKFLNNNKYNVQMVFQKPDKINAYNNFLSHLKINNNKKNITVKEYEFSKKEEIIVPIIKKTSTTKTKIKNKKIFDNSRHYIKNDKLKKIINQIESLSLEKYKELISISLRTIIEITCVDYLSINLKKSKTWFNDNDLKDLFIETIKDLEKEGFFIQNKTTMIFWKNNIPNFIFASNGYIHDVQLISTKKELEDILKRVSIFLEEAWRKID
ncbi:MAG: hypothetical protein GY679_04485 [Mycoplasma sp.]|nr:hypothetical protein [Mycoplasma sp.]